MSTVLFYQEPQPTNTSASGAYHESVHGEDITLATDTSTSESLQSRIVKTFGVCGGDARISGTRIPVWMLLESRDAGYTDRVLLDNYSFLSQEDLDSAWDYAKDHEAELRQQIAENQDA
ncbi:MAG: hypothetical protein CMJ50_03090 [Planctomycetaceae bacterium]|nr:hypothetical protein [Planctomycetaceae bacterium]